MIRIESGNQHQLRYRRGTGIYGLLGLPFLLFGLVAFAFCSFALRALDFLGILVGFVMGGPFLLLGASIVGWRAEFLFDRAEGKLTRSWGILFPMRKKYFSLKDFKELSIKPENRVHRFAGRTRMSTWTVYPLTLIGPAASEHLFESTSPEYSIRHGREIAAFLNLPLNDHSRDNMVPTRESASSGGRL
ncbi:MAG: hypothetical protein AAB229_05990 [Candidatus Hydrogenedentota bacterium]